jgi:hypothetical protein
LALFSRRSGAGSSIYTATTTCASSASEVYREER